MTRVGLVAKTGLHAAAGALADLAGWLEARDVHAVFETRTAAIAGLPAGRPTVERDRLPNECDLIVVLGGDGTLIGMADRIAQSGVDVPILGVNFGSLGFLTEVTLPELYGSLESVLAGDAQIEERMMLRARTWRDDAVCADRLALNDIALVRLRLSEPLAVDPYAENRATGAFILIDEASNETVGAGMIRSTSA